MGSKAKGVVPQLVEVFGSNRSLANSAVQTLVDIGPDSVHALTKALQNKTTRDYAIDALIKLNAKKAIPDLERALDDKKEGVKQSAAEALKSIRGTGTDK